MNSYTNPYTVGTVSELPEENRAQFIRKTYAHLAGAIALFVLLEAVFFSIGLHVTVMSLLGTGRYSWLIVLGLFMGVSWLAEKWANNGASQGMQYAGLALYTLAEAVIFLPLITMAMLMTGDFSLLIQAGMITFAMVLGISAVALTTRKDFSFLGGILKVGGVVALGMIALSFFLPITLGFWFSALMVVFASGCILYNTSNLIHHYQPGQHVAASLSLFASVALLFWYVLQMLMRFGRD
jgi:FtsH-binding integral membrane protein